MKINLPIFKDEDAKDAVTYRSWRWDLTVYRCTGCRDHTLLPYAIRSLQGYPGELVQSSSTDITLDDVLMILEEHYNNVKVLDALNQELFQMRMADKETVLDCGDLSLQAFTNIGSILSRPFSPRLCSRTKERSFLWWTFQTIESNGGLPEGRPQVRMYSDYLRATGEAEKEDSIELSRSSRSQPTDGPFKPRTTSFFHLRKLKGSQPFPKKPAVQLAQLDEDDTDDGKDPESDDPDGIEGVTEDFMIWLARAVKDAQMDEKRCYHCS